jgi:hypothetical protein
MDVEEFHFTQVTATSRFLENVVNVREDWENNTC